MSISKETLLTLSVTDSARDEAVARLQDLCGEDLITIEDFEKRIEMVEMAESKSTLELAMSGLPSMPDTNTALVPAHESAATSTTVLALMGGSERKGQWRPPARITSIAVMGGAKLDFSDAIIEGVIDVRCFTVMGGTEIIVPANVHVDISGVGVMGGFTNLEQHPGRQTRATIRVRGVALMGGVDVKVKKKGLLHEMKEALLGTGD